MNPIKPGWEEFVNNSGSTIPARGIVRVKDVVTLEPGRIQLKVDQPNTYGDIGNCFIIGPVPVISGKYGSCTRTAESGVVTALYDEATGTPAYGQQWGPISGSFKLSAKGQGWLCLGAPVNTSRKLALFTPMPITELRGVVTGGDIADGATGTIKVYQRTGSTAYTDTTYTVTALNDLGQSVTNGSRVRIAPEPYVSGGTATVGWALTQATC